MENTHLVFYLGVSGFSKNTYEFEKMGIRLAGCIDEVRCTLRMYLILNALKVVRESVLRKRKRLCEAGDIE